MLSREEAINLLKKYEVPERAIKHSLMVEKNALEIARQVEVAGTKVDKEILSMAAILHDIGRYKICLEKGYSQEQLGLHAPEGQILLEKLGFRELAQIAGGHFLTEVSQEEAQKLGWPISVKLPDTIEAKIVCIADKIRSGKPIEKEVRRIFEREDLKLRYFNRVPRLKEGVIGKTLAIVEELKSLGWSGRVSP